MPAEAVALVRQARVALRGLAALNDGAGFKDCNNEAYPVITALDAFLARHEQKEPANG